MTYLEALQIVHELAVENVISERECEQDKEVLLPMRNLQLAALDLFHEHTIKGLTK